MKNTGIAVALAISLLLVFVSCNSSEKAARVQALAQLQRMDSAVRDMNIVVSVGTTRDQYSQRLSDALPKFGSQEDDCKQVTAEFPAEDQQSSAETACQHLLTAMDAYMYAKDYIGPKADPIDPEMPDYNLTEKEYADAKSRFPNLEELPTAETNEDGYKFYRRRDMVQALWRLADHESELAKNDIENLARSR